MLKLIRNILAKLKILFDEAENIIEWKYFEELHQLQEAEGLHLANKVRSKHIAFEKNKMKVKLAAQLLSTSVANSLSFCKDTLKLPQFQNCSATVKFTSIFNDLFDILNSKNQRQHGFKKPISVKNSSAIITKLEECAEYIKKLSLPNNKQNILNSKVKTGFLGFLINIKSMIEMYKFTCVDNNYLKYIPMYKVSQDHLELMFGSKRSHGGYNNNPTTKQFKSAVKKLIINTEIREKSTGNCINLENIPILHASSLQNSVNIINKTVSSHEEWLDIFHTVEVDHDYSFNMCLPLYTTYKNEVISYIAGFIVKKLMKNLRCAQCINALIGKNDEIDQNLINIKNRGSLIYPSRDVIYICKKVDSVITMYIKINKNLSNININSFTNDLMQNIFSYTSQSIFNELNDHINDQCFFSNHLNHLIKSIISLYAKVKLTHYTG